MNEPRTVSELYPSQWVRSRDLNGKAVTVTIQAVTVEEFRTPDGRTHLAAVLAFVGKKKRLILNKTQCKALVAITGSERFADWVGCEVQLAPATAPNGKPTIGVQRVVSESEQG